MKASAAQIRHATLALILLLLAGLLLWIILLPAWKARADFREQLGELQLQFGRYSDLAAQTPQLRAALSSLQAGADDRIGYLEDQPETLAAAALQDRLRSLIETHGGNVISTQALPIRTAELFPAVTIKVQLRAGVDSLRDILLAAATAPTFLVIDNLSIQVRSTGSGRRKQQDTDLVEARFDVTAWMHRSGT